MKKILIILVLFQAFAFVYSNEDASTDKNYAEIRKESGPRFYKDNQLLKTRNDFIKALSPVPQAKELYLISQMWKTSGIVLLGTSTGTQITFFVSFTFALIYGDQVAYYYSDPKSYEFPVLGLSFIITFISSCVLLIPQLIVMAVSFFMQYKKEKEAVILYNNTVKEFKEKTGFKFNMSPFVALDKDKEYSGGIVFYLRFN